jgi:predicted dehydrogenase
MAGDVRIGMIGAGMVGQLAHLANFVQIPGCRVTALAELRPRLGALTAQQFGVPKVFDNHHDMLAANVIDAAVVVTRRPATGPVVRDMLNAGKHVLSEKPMAHTTEQARRLVDAAARGQLIYSIGFMKRHDEGTAAAKQLFDRITSNNDVGRVILMRGWCFCGEFNISSGGFVMTDEKRPEGLELWPLAPDWIPKSLQEDYAWFLNVFVHDVNILRYFAGRTLKVQNVDLRRRNGRVVIFDSGSYPVILEMGEQAGTDWNEGMDIQFERGRLTIEFPSPLKKNKAANVVLVRGNTTTTIETASSWSFRRQAEAFVADIAGNTPPLASGADSIADLVLVESIWRMHLGIT